MSLDPYQVLGVSRSASQDDIKSAYRKLARKLHPDLNPGNKEAEKRFKEISLAYDLIGTAEKRTKFERGEAEEELLRKRRAESGPFYYETQQGQAGRYSKMFEEDLGADFFDSLFRQQAKAEAQQALYSLAIDFKESVLGGERELLLPKGRKIRIQIPPGVRTGTRLRYGDLLIELEVRESDLFHRKGNDLEIDFPLSLSEAILGGEVKVPTVDGPVSLKVPPGVNTGSRLRLRGKGVPDSKTGKRGDQFVKVQIMLPERVDQELEKAIREWSTNHAYDPRGRRAA
ncbi:MAG: hypothetical protein A2X94_12925 [Bdellovibrionales bacterium GWB1_55_8]|nr:MAG: hypothetical protein A2X94_12925 [Bdellovibrionales bacterium GWB1_55_8]